jgi:hypothetical protein
MAEEKGCPGCPGSGSIDPELLGQEYMDHIMGSMETTKSSLDSMMKTVENMQVNDTMFSGLEKQIKQINEYLNSGEFFQNIEKTIKMYAEVKPDAMQNMAQYYASQAPSDLDKMIATLNEIKAMQAGNTSSESVATE